MPFKVQATNSDLIRLQAGTEAIILNVLRPFEGPFYYYFIQSTLIQRFFEYLKLVSPLALQLVQTILARPL